MSASLILPPPSWGANVARVAGFPGWAGSGRRQLAEGHGGRLAIERSELGVGTTFALTLRQTATSPAAPALSPIIPLPVGGLTK